jgi:nuclear transport factor 2 (NTF2) superfamily protein
MTGSAETRPPLPPFSHHTAVLKVRAAEDAWNSRDPERVALGYTEDSIWRNRAEFPRGRRAIIEFLSPQMGQGAGVPSDQGAVGLHRQSARSTVRL